MAIYVKISFISIFSPFPNFWSRSYLIHWFYPYRSFKHYYWRRRKL